MVEAFNGAVVKKKNFFVNFQCSEFICFWSVSRESAKELIYQKKNGGHQVSHVFDMLVVLRASTKKNCILVC